VCAALSVQAVGSDRVFALCLPERDSDPGNLSLAQGWASQLGIRCVVEDISGVLDAAGCYRRRDEAIRRVVPEYTTGWRCKLVLPGGRLEGDRLNVTSLVVQPPDGEMRSVRLPAAEYRQIVAATNFKQRTRAMMGYYHADRLHYAVVGTPNRLEYDQGFFVKGGDGLADIKPIAHLYKTQVYQLADYLGVPESVTSRPPTSDTFSLPQTQEEFYFTVPTAQMDRLLYARTAGLSVADASRLLDLPSEMVERAFADIDRKRSTTQYLHASPRFVDPIPEVHIQ
jgi:NAD+ synthase